MEKELTALQYQNILIQLPSPKSVLEQGRRNEIEINYVTEPLNTRKILHGTPDDGVSEYAKVDSVIFEIVERSHIPFWQPKYTIKIIPQKSNREFEI